jgi:hypothetical protein
MVRGSLPIPRKIKKSIVLQCNVNTGNELSITDAILGEFGNHIRENLHLNGIVKYHQVLVIGSTRYLW